MCKSGKPWRLPSSFFAQISIVASRQIINTRMPRVLVVKLTESYKHFLPNFINVCSSGLLSCSREAGEHKSVQRCRKPVLMLDSETWRQGIRFATWLCVGRLSRIALAGYRAAVASEPANTPATSSHWQQAARTTNFKGERRGRSFVSLVGWLEQMGFCFHDFCASKACR